MTAVGIVPHPQRAVAYAERAARCLIGAGVEVRVPAPDAEAVGLPDLAWDLETFPAGLDFVLSLGGDGTMLRTVDLVASEGVPVLGVNLGQLGFLTEVEPPQLEEALHRALTVGASGQEELIAEELRLAARALGRLTGRVDVEDVLDVIFRDFCIGK